MTPIRITIAAALAALAAPAMAQDAGSAMSLCQIEVDAAEIKAPSRTPEVVGYMKRISGQVNVLRPTRDGEVEEVVGAIGMDLYPYDAVVTGPAGGFDAFFTDNSTVSGVANTCIEISEYVYKPVENEGQFRMRLGRGTISIAAGQVAKIKGDTMSVRVRNDTNLAVTGTRLVVRAK